LEEFLKNKLDEERSQVRKIGKFAIVMDEEVDREQYEILEDIN
jgi:hypothetical protein